MRLFVLAAGLAAVLIPATGASAQYRGYGYDRGHHYGHNNRAVQREIRECRRELRRADSRREYRRELRECRREIARAQRESRYDRHRGRYGDRYRGRYYDRYDRYDRRGWRGRW